MSMQAASNTLKAIRIKVNLSRHIDEIITILQTASKMDDIQKAIDLLIKIKADM